MRIQPKSQYPETQVSNASSQEAKPIVVPEENTAHSDSAEGHETKQNAEQNAYERDQASTGPLTERHQQPANQVRFGESTDAASPTSSSIQSASRSSSDRSLQELQSLFKEKRSVTDPAVLKLLDYIREMEDKNIQHMLDMMQESLDRAHEMMKKNEKIYYTETLPKLEGVKALIAQEQSNLSTVKTQTKDQESAQLDQALSRSDRTVAHKLQHLTREIQQTADIEVPPNHAQLLIELQQALQLALVL